MYKLLMLFMLFAPLLVHGDQATVSYEISDLSKWQKKSFKGETVYTVEKEGYTAVLRAESTDSASGYYRKISLDSKAYHFINWSWKVQGVVPAEDPHSKTFDDYAARVYIVFPGRFFWQKRSIVYVWADRLSLGEIIASPFTDRVAIIAVESGNRYAGIWKHERRNYLEDYRRYFKKEPEDPVAVAFMTDTDNTGGHALAWYGDICFSR